MSVLIIAEAGVNHDGDLDAAHALVDAAAEAGADYVKFQTFRADRLVTRSAAKAAYQEARGPGGTQHEMLARLELDESAHDALASRCRERGIGFLSTAFDLESLGLLVRLGVDRIKVPSGEITNLEYLHRAGGLGLPVLLSTGMATLDEVREAVDAMAGAGADRADITVLHCTTEYPAPMDGVNLRAMVAMGAALGLTHGYSDHTTGIEVPIAAVALGAVVIEKHLTLDRSRSGPDHAASLEPDEMAAMVAAIRNVERALGDGVKRPTSGELANRRVVRRSLVAGALIRAGEPFTTANLSAKRPGTGISPMRIADVLGCAAPRDFEPDELIEL
jgi:N,N'-diacetyllegionaminate synthase